MAARQPKPEPTPHERQVMDRVKRARRSYANIDRWGEYMRLSGELAEETGGDVVAIYEEWQDRVQALLMTSEPDVYEAEQAAMNHVRAAWSKDIN